jgi:hypothetical protein
MLAVKEILYRDRDKSAAAAKESGNNDLVSGLRLE